MQRHAIGIPASALAAGAILFCSGLLWADTPPAGPTPIKHGTAETKPDTRTAEQKKQDNIGRVMEFFHLTQPDMYDQANALRSTDPAKFDKLILDALPTVNHLEILRQNKPVIFALSMQDLQLGYLSLRLAHELKRTDLSESDRTHLMQQLQQVVASEFDVQQKIRQFEIDDLQTKIKNLNDQVKARQSDKETLLQKRTDDLTKGTPRLEW